MSRNEQQPKWKEERRKHGIEGDTNKKNTAKRVQSSKSWSKNSLIPTISRIQTPANKKIILKTPELDFFTIPNLTKIQNTLFVRSILIDFTFMYALKSLHTLISRKLKKLFSTI